MSTRRSPRSKASASAATATDPIHVDSGTATPETTTPPHAVEETLKKDQQLETSVNVVDPTNDSSAPDTPATPADTPSAAPEEPEEHKINDDEHKSKEEDEHAKEAAPDPDAIGNIDEDTKKDDEPAVPIVEESAEPTDTPTEEVTAGIKRPEPDSLEEAEKESKDYLEGAYKSSFRHAVPSANKTEETSPQEAS